MKANAVIFLLFVASVFYTTAAGVQCDSGLSCTSYEAYAVAVGSISLVVSLGLLILTNLAEVSNIVHQIASVFLFLWWVFGACFGTFKQPFSTPNLSANGYFSAWLAFFLATYYVLTAVSHVKEGANAFMSSNFVFLGIAAGAQLVYLIAAAILVDNANGNSTSYMNYALAAGCIGFFITLCLIALRVFKSDSYEKGAMYPAGFLFLWWIIAFGVTTFKAPFISLSNGYFAAWASMIATGLLFAATLDKDIQESIKRTVSMKKNNNVSEPSASGDEPVDGAGTKAEESAGQQIVEM